MSFIHSAAARMLMLPNSSVCRAATHPTDSSPETHHTTTLSQLNAPGAAAQLLFHFIDGRRNVCSLSLFQYLSSVLAIFPKNRKEDSM